MSRQASPSTGRRYGIERACEAGGLPRSTFYARRPDPSGADTSHGERGPEMPEASPPGSGGGAPSGASGNGAGKSAAQGCASAVGTELSPVASSMASSAGLAEVQQRRRRGPKPTISDEELLAAIREEIAASPFIGEGHRKLWKRLRLRGEQPVCVSRKRVLRVMREAHLLSPHRLPQRPPVTHDGHIVTTEPNVIWGTDGARFETVEEGWAWVFVAVEHWNAECVGAHVTKTGDRFAALEPISQGLERYFHGLGADVAVGLAVRSDHGTQYNSEHFGKQLKFWGARHSYGFVREPETNGVAERFIRTLKEQVFHGRIYRNVAEAREAVRKFVEKYNAEWLVEKNGLVSPHELRRRRDEASAERLAA